MQARQEGPTATVVATLILAIVVILFMLVKNYAY
jgi:hypothetical protein